MLRTPDFNNMSFISMMERFHGEVILVSAAGRAMRLSGSKVNLDYPSSFRIKCIFYMRFVMYNIYKRLLHI